MMRGSPACVVMRPNVPALKFTWRVPQLKWLKRLNASRRSSSLCVAGHREQPDMARLTFQ